MWKYRGRLKAKSDIQLFCSKKCHTDSMKKDPKKKTRSRASKIRGVQTYANRYARLRDCAGTGGAVCISCPEWFPFDKGDGGHFIPTTSSATRFDERNINFQCHKCNRFMHGNIRMYFRGMEKKYGRAIVDELEAMAGPKKWTDDELRDIREYYKGKIRDLESGSGESDSGPMVSDLFSGSV